MTRVVALTIIMLLSFSSRFVTPTDRVKGMKRKHQRAFVVLSTTMPQAGSLIAHKGWVQAQDNRKETCLIAAVHVLPRVVAASLHAVMACPSTNRPCFS